MNGEGLYFSKLHNDRFLAVVFYFDSIDLIQIGHFQSNKNTHYMYKI